MAKGLLIAGCARTTSTYALAAFRLLAMKVSTAVKVEIELVIKKAAVS